MILTGFARWMGRALYALALTTGVANAALFEFEWADGYDPILKAGYDSADLNTYLTLEPSDPPLPQDELGFLGYIISQFSFNGNEVETIAYTSHLEDYVYQNCGRPLDHGVAGTHVSYDAVGPILDHANTGGQRLLISTATIQALPCAEPPGDDVFLFIGDPNRDLVLKGGDMTTRLPIRNGTPSGLALTVVCIPEPGSVVLLAMGCLTLMRRRR